ncbi:TetR family transcriptional regulator [Actinomadura terrae]|uniref:TetR family transcriptional regulator n=1 Tax=Actinomadura terrae TaxID=604353 RepID=UPI001FA6D4CD|nr:TetR family transcriptional regulator [Actinomadura terrae]
MGRPPRHDVGRLLDVAVELAADGPGRVTVAAVARAAGAPSGSVYHRFEGLPALRAALWLRTVERFQAGFLDALRGEPPERAAGEAARHVVAWSRAHPAEARVLLHGRSALDEDGWPERDRARLGETDRRVGAAVRDLAGRLGVEEERAAVAVIDLPYAIVRRHLLGGGTIAPGTEDRVAEAAVLLSRR